MTNSRRNTLFKLFCDVTQKKTIVEPMKNLHGSLRDEFSIEKELSVIAKEIIENELLPTDLQPIQVAKIIIGFYAGKTDNRIATELGNTKLTRSVGRARIKLKMFRDFDFNNIPFSKEEMDNLLNSGKTWKKISDDLGIHPSVFRHYRNIYAMKDDQRIIPYLDRIMMILEDRDLNEHYFTSIHKDGLKDTIDLDSMELTEEIT
jgi:hypothetical protein